MQTLAHNSTATLSVIKDYLINKLQRENQQIEDDERKICRYRVETAHLRSEIQDLKTRCVRKRMNNSIDKIQFSLIEQFLTRSYCCASAVKLSNCMTNLHNVSTKCKDIPEDQV